MTVNELQQIKEDLIKFKYDRMLKFYKDEMKFFIDSDSIPSVPKVSKEEYESIIIPAYIRCGAIPKSELIDGIEYEGSCRNASKAIWDANSEKFIYLRTKFGMTYKEEINHFEDDDGYDLFVPLKEIENDNSQRS